MSVLKIWLKADLRDASKDARPKWSTDGEHLNKCWTLGALNDTRIAAATHPPGVEQWQSAHCSGELRTTIWPIIIITKLHLV